MMERSSDSGIQAVGQVLLGTHFCQFYRTRQDLVDTLVPFFMAGLRNNELCMWVTSAPLEAAEAEALLCAALPEFSEYVAKRQIEIWDYREWYLVNGETSAGVLQGWIEREERALREGFSGLRLTGNTFWLEPGMWDAFMAYEREVNEAFGQRQIIALCSYNLDRCRAEDVIDVCGQHQFALARRHGNWELMESSSLKIAKADLARLNTELEQRVTERTAELEQIQSEKGELTEAQKSELEEIAVEQGHVADLARDLTATVSQEQEPANPDEDPKGKE